MSIRRIALIFDDQVRPDTTGVYCLRALRRLTEVHHVRPAQLPSLEPGGFDLYLNVDDGLDYRLPPQLRPAALWAIDTHLDPDRIVRRATEVDVAFAAQRDGVELLRARGVNCAGWLPLACDPAVHRPHAVAKDVDVSFVGHINCPERAELLTTIRAAHPGTYVGQLFFDDMARQYARSRIVFNRSVRNDVNMRVFEAAACGSLLVTNDLADNGLGHLFEAGTHLVTYRSEQELLGKLSHYLGDGDERERIAAAGRARALTRHTYLHRMSELLRQCEAIVDGGPHSQVAVRRRDESVPTQVCPAPLANGLTSIVVLTHDQLAYTKLCVQSILERTDAEYELIVVDNASTDGTRQYLRSVPGVRVIENDRNEGFPHAANQGIRAARGEQVVLLNNDVVVTSGWLGRLLRPLGEDPQISLVGPCSNQVSGPQQVPADYRDLEELDAFAARRALEHGGRREPADRLVGFCLLFRRALIDRIGLLDERFGIGNFEDDDFCRRAAIAGHLGVIAQDCFVHHFGSRTFLAEGVDYAGLLDENRRLFHEKWSQPDVAAAGRGELPATAATLPAANGIPPEPPAAPAEPVLSLCMIVRDSARTLPACLQSIAPWVDEMVVVDTGSTDRTVEIATEAGARVCHFPWCDDFAAARNESLRLARGRWIFWMDADDTIDADCGRRLRELARQEHDPIVLGYVMQVRCPGPSNSDGAAADLTAVDHVKLLRNRPDLRFEGRIHEQVLPAIRRAGGEVAWTDLFVTHSGSDQSPEGRARKRARDLRILNMELAERPGHTFTLFNLGMTHADGGAHAAAIDALRASLAAAGPGDSHVRKIYALLAASYGASGREADALETCDRGLAACPGDRELLFRRATLLHRLGRLDDAESVYLSLLGGVRRRYFASVDVGILGPKVRHNLAVLHAEAARHEAAELQWRAVLREQPGNRAARRGLWQALKAQGKCDELAAEADRAAADPDPAVVAEAWCLRGELALLRGERETAREHLEHATRESPNDADALSALCGFLFDHGTLAEAEASLGRLVALAPDNAAAYHNLGTVCLRQDRAAEAAEHYRRSLDLRPRSPATRQLLAHAKRLAEPATAPAHEAPAADAADALVAS